jgi:N-acetylmuramoyl-L-alanine amidase
MRYFTNLFLLIGVLLVACSSNSHQEINFSDALSRHFKSNWIPREAWQARAPRKDISHWAQNWNSFSVHHTAGTALSSEKTVQDIQNFHMDTHKWSDIGYHFLLGDDGKIYEGRSLSFQGAHVKDHNANTVGIAALGCFDEKECDGIKNPTATKMTIPLLYAFGELIGVLAYKNNLTDLSASNVKGHLEFSGAKTACPGNIIMNYIDDIIAIANQTVKQLKLMAA